MRLETQVVDVKDSYTDLDSFAEHLRQLAEGQAIKVLKPDGVSMVQLFHALYSKALRSGLRISIRQDGDYVFVFRKQRLRKEQSSSARNAKRDIAIVEAIARGITYADIAAEFGLTRQRVEQLYLRNEVDNLQHSPVADRREAQIERMQPFLEAAASPFKCISCGELLLTHSNGTSKVVGPQCAPCRKARRLLATIKSLLHTHLQGASEYALNQAAYLIRKHGVKPEDFRFV